MIQHLLQSLTDATAEVDISLQGYHTAYLRAFQAWDTGFRTLPEHLLYYLESGTIALETQGESTKTRSGSVIILPPGREFRMHAVAGEPAPAFWRLRLTLPRPWPGASAWSRSKELKPVILALVEELPVDRPYRRERILGLLLALFAHLARQAEETTVERTATAFGLPARQLLERHVAMNPQATPRDLARQLDLTLDYFTRRFRDTFGIPPRAWLLEQRLQAAAMMLAEGSEDAVVIARRVGFIDPRRFSSRFRQRFGHPPGRFRQISGGNRFEDTLQ